jgi:hypothetical protein
MPNVHKCGACGSILKGFHDDCIKCLGKEEPQKVDTEMELMFQEEREHRERAEASQEKIRKHQEKNGN